MKTKDAAVGLIASVALGLSGWSLVTTVNLTNDVTALKESKASKETVYELSKTQAVLAEAMKNQTLILSRMEKKLERQEAATNGAK